MTMTMLRKLYRKFSDLVAYINKCSIFDCTVYDISVIKDLKVSQISRDLIVQEAIHILSFDNVISEPDEFLKNTVKPNIRNFHKDKNYQLSA